MRQCLGHERRLRSWMRCRLALAGDWADTAAVSPEVWDPADLVAVDYPAAAPSEVEWARTAAGFPVWPRAALAVPALAVREGLMQPAVSAVVDWTAVHWEGVICLVVG